MKRLRRLSVILVMLLVASVVGCSSQPEPEHQERFEEIEKAFATASTPEDYVRVAGDYGKLFDDGARGAAVLFNQGNAFARAERYGNAIACYRRALRLEPTNELVLQNLQTAMSKTRATDAPRGWFRRIVLWQDAVGYRTKFMIATVLVVLTSLALLVARRKRSQVLSRLGIILVGLMVVFAASAVFDWYRYEYVVSGTIVQSGVVPRTGNGESYEAAFNQPLAEGTALVVLEQRGDWLRISVPGAGTGWIQQGTTVLY